MDIVDNAGTNKEHETGHDEFINVFGEWWTTSFQLGLRRAFYLICSEGNRIGLFQLRIVEQMDVAAVGIPSWQIAVM